MPWDCPPEKVALCKTAQEGGCRPCGGFSGYAADCCAMCARYCEGGFPPPGWYERNPRRCFEDFNPGSCTAIAEDSDDIRDYMPAMWFDPPCLMFVPADE